MKRRNEPEKESGGRGVRAPGMTCCEHQQTRGGRGHSNRPLNAHQDTGVITGNRMPFKHIRIQ
ncbi:hypothetical protein E2C01_029188 [Portunus trituberculatus]|uniref:Uncharacterized protein n=1 Tax=Portunus trituberculatus TaxID=210409 RepID=A0A5B7ES58_PORTR|nr:hypothetical protein [Portunus trituberculatus]